MTEHTGNGLVVHEPQVAMAPALIGDAEIARTWRVANALARSRFFKDALQAEQAFAKMLLGRDLGLSPTQAMIGIHIVEGKPEVSANLQAQFVREYVGPDGTRYDYKRVEATDEVCELQFLRRRVDSDEWEVLGNERFTMEDAKRAGLTNPSRNGAPSMYVKYPRNMLFARCMSNGSAFHCPEVNNGHRLYYPGEVTESDEITDAVVIPGPEETPTGEMPGGDGPDAPPIEGTAEDDAGARLIAFATELAERKIWTARKLNAQLVAAGATTTASVEAAVASMTPEQADELAGTIADAIAVADESTAAEIAEQALEAGADETVSEATA
jgi:hypothetical protein